MELYEIIGEYPDSNTFHSYVLVNDPRDAIALAQGIRKVTTVHSVAVYAMDDDRCIFCDELKTPSL